MHVIAIDPGIVNTGLVHGFFETKEVVHAGVYRPEVALDYLFKTFQDLPDEEFVVVVEDVTPRRLANPKVWGVTLALARIVGMFMLLCRITDVKCVLQNPLVVKQNRGRLKTLGLDTDPAQKREHLDEAYKHFLHYIEENSVG